MTDEPKLKPCPFCGGDAITTPSVVDRLVMYAHCKDHTCPGWTVSRTNAAYWNLRAIQPEVTALVEALRGDGGERASAAITKILALIDKGKTNDS